MSDIVERLRDGEAHYSAVVVEGLNGYSLQLFKEAADEIERLRVAANNAFYAMCAYRDSPTMIDEFQDEIDSLGMALKR